jgi:hypothetical protein
MLTHPLADVVSELDETVLNIMKALVDKNETPEGKLAKAYGVNFLKIMKLMQESWFRNAMSNDISFQCAMLSIYQMLNK